MGYSVYYKPPKEMVDELKNTYKIEELFSIAKSELIKLCMESIDNIFQFHSNINKFFKTVYNSAKADADSIAYDQFQEDGEIGFYGWDKARENTWSNIDELCSINYYELFILAIVPTPDYFDDKDKYYEKYNDICVIIDEFRESCFNFAQFELMEKFKEYKNE